MSRFVNAYRMPGPGDFPTKTETEHDDPLWEDVVHMTRELEHSALWDKFDISDIRELAYERAVKRLED